jgi:drug/metabolite transporter (DMT)-like permease
VTTVSETSLAPTVRPDRAGFFALLGGTAIVAWSAIVVRFADVGPLSSAAWRMLFALPVLWIWTRHLASTRGSGAVQSPLPAWIKVAVVVSGLAFAADVATFHLSLGATDIANASFIANIAPILVVIGGAAFYREHARAQIWAALGLALFGSWMMAGLLAPAALGRGDLFALCAAFFYAGYVLTLKQVRTRLDGAAATLWTAAVSAVALVVVALLSGETFLPRTVQGWAAVAFLGIGSHAAGQGLTSIGVGRVPVGLVAIVMLTWAPISAFLAWAIFDERLNTLQVSGAAVILGALVLAHPRWSRG